MQTFHKRLDAEYFAIRVHTRGTVPQVIAPLFMLKNDAILRSRCLMIISNSLGTKMMEAMEIKEHPGSRTEELGDHCNIHSIAFECTIGEVFLQSG